MYMNSCFHTKIQSQFSFFFLINTSARRGLDERLQTREREREKKPSYLLLFFQTFIYVVSDYGAAAAVIVLQKERKKKE